MSVMPITKISTGRKQLPPLENGDHLDQETFHERYEAMPPNVRAELIGGIVYMASPVGTAHSKEHLKISAWVANYEAATEGVEAFLTPTIILNEDCEPQPDAAIRLLSGKTKIVRRGKKLTEYVAGAPEFVMEAASSSESIDLHAKRRDYEKYGVAEYACFLIRTRKVVWLIREKGKFVELKPAGDGILKSRIFPGLWLDPEALVAGNLPRMLKVLSKGIASPEHAAFVAKLASKS